MEPWGFEPQILPCHGSVIPFHYGPGFTFRVVNRNPSGRGVKARAEQARPLTLTHPDSSPKSPLKKCTAPQMIAP
jgi:hypothetical protein